MENSLLSGDVILISKLHYGGRIPKSIMEVPWLNLFSIFFFSNEKINSIQRQLPSDKRFLSFSNVKRGDIIIMNDPWNYQNYLIKRCMAIKGDSFSIKSSELVINGKIEEEYPFVKKMYSVDYPEALNMRISFSKLVDSLNIPYFEDRIQKKRRKKNINMTTRQKRRLGAFIGYNLISLDTLDNYNVSLIPFSGYKNDEKNYEFLYEKYEKKNKLHYEKSDNCSFSKDYYFIMGDNRKFSTDSRVFGPIPDNLIVGKAIIVLFSFTSDGKIRKDRCFKKI